MLLGHVDVTERAVTVLAAAHLLLTGAAAGVEAEGIGAIGIAIAILLSGAGDTARGVTTQGVAGAVGLVLALALTIST